MLNNLSIKDFAIIQKSDINFSDHLTVMTGETGAGKSMVIDALSLLIGGRSSVSMIRKGTQKAVVQGMFDFPNFDLSEFGIEDDQQLVIRREINRKGKNLISVNGIIFTLKQLSSLGNKLVKISAQFDNRNLFDPRSQAELLDRFGDISFQKRLQDYRDKFARYSVLRKKIFDLDEKNKQQKKQIDFLRFEYQDLSALKLKKGELDALDQEERSIKNFEKKYKLLSQLISDLDGNEKESVISLLEDGSRQLNDLTDFDNDYQKDSDRLASNLLDLKELARDFRDKMAKMSFDTDQAEHISDRISQIKAAERKYHRVGDELFDYYQSLKKQIDQIENFDQNQQKLRDDFESYRHELIDLATKMHQQRQKIAGKLKKMIENNLQDLLLPDVRLTIRITQTKKLSSTGFDQIEFWLQTNPGEAFLPLNEIASGGEVSRILLALINVFSKTLSIPTLVFDEIDTGVSGRAAVAVAKKMSSISSERQVISISHLPQVAAWADHQLQIEKKVEHGRTFTFVHPLNEEQRVLSIANMISGEKITKEAKAGAREMLKQKTGTS
ncbi:DNA repair protein RecN [Oenococcus alcoholitolerans]|uniref:DNA repair protein RecN n=1 Tax=Oenococcus alcoholitolerans TaxID=931074 RepID=UPI003F70D479